MKKRILFLIMAVMMTVTMSLSAIAAAESASSVNPSPGTDATDYDCTGKYVNIALVVDTTGSMDDDIRAVRDNLIEFVKIIAASGAIPRISLIEYKDMTNYGDGLTSTKLHAAKDYSVWFDNAEDMVAEIGTLTTGGGPWECLIDALGYLVDDNTMTFNKYAAKFAIVVTDEPFADYNRWGIQDMSAMIDLLKNKEIQTTVITDSFLKSYYDELIDGTGGTFLEINSEFSKDLAEYAKKIIATTAGTKVDDSYVPVTKIELGTDQVVLEGGIYKYPVTITPDNATVKEILWEIKDTSIAELNSDLTNSEYCVINTKKTGSTDLVAKTADGGYTAHFTITVEEVVTDGETTLTCKMDKVADLINTATTEKVNVLSPIDGGTTVNGTTLADIFSRLKDTKKTVEFSFTDAVGDVEYSWAFAGDKINDATRAITDFRIDKGIINKDMDGVISDAGGVTGEFEGIHFKHDGVLPGTATVRVKVGLVGDNLYLYYYNPASKSLELVSSAVKIDNGYACFSVDHCSDYVLSTKLLKTDNAKVEEVVKTGDRLKMLPFAIAAVLSFATAPTFMYVKVRSKKIVK